MQISADAINKPIKLKGGNNKDQVLLRIPKSGNSVSFDRNMRRHGFLDHLLENLTPPNVERKTTVEWLLASLAKKEDASFESVARDCDFLTSSTKRMDEHAAAAMWEDSNVNTTQQRTILRHFFGYFGVRLVAKETNIRAIGEGYLEPVTGSYETVEQEKVEFWYKLVDDHLRHEIANSIDSNQEWLKDLSMADISIGGDHGKGRFRLVLMVFLRSASGLAWSRRFVIGEITCRKDTDDILRKTFMLKQGEALKRISEEGRFIVTRDNESRRLGLHFTYLPPESNATVVADVPSRIFVCGDLAFYALVLGKDHMAPHWC